MSKEADVVSRLGEPEQVAEATATAYRQRSFLGRHRVAAILVFAVSPVLLMLVFVAIAGVGIAMYGTICRHLGVTTWSAADRTGGGVRTLLDCATSLVAIVIPSLLASYFYCKLAVRYCIGRKWMLVSCGVLAVMSSLFSSWVTLSHIPGKSTWSLGFGFPPHLPQLGQLLVPLAIGWWFLRRVRRQGKVQLAS